MKKFENFEKFENRLLRPLGLARPGPRRRQTTPNLNMKQIEKFERSAPKATGPGQAWPEEAPTDPKFDFFEKV
jgi:hypothetical protein